MLTPRPVSRLGERALSPRPGVEVLDLRHEASVRPVVFGSGRPFFATGGLAEPLRLENPTTIVPGDRVTHLVYDVCTG